MLYSLSIPGVEGVLGVFDNPSVVGIPSVQTVRVPRLQVGTQPETERRTRQIRLICGLELEVCGGMVSTALEHG